MSDYTIEYDYSDFIAKTNFIQTKLHAGILLVTERVSQKVEEWAKQNAPWSDRTGDARRLLSGSAFWEDRDNIVMMISHGVPYGVYLELAFAREYAILDDAIEAHKDELINAVSRLLSKVV